MPTMGARAVGGELLVYVGGRVAPADSEWAAYARLAGELGRELLPRSALLRICVFVDDGAPNAKQRALLAEELHGVSVRAAVVTKSKLARHTITVFGWLGGDMRGFAPSAMSSVAAYLNLTSAELRAVVDVASALAPTVDGVQAVTDVLSSPQRSPSQPW